MTAAAADSDQRHRELGEDLEAVNHFSGINFSPSATVMATISTGIMFIRISAKVNSTGCPLISTPEYIATKAASDTANRNGHDTGQYAQSQITTV